MANRILIKHRHRQILERLLSKHLPGVEVWAYGSRVNGRGHDGSDLDLVLRAPDLKAIPYCQLSDFEDAVRDSTIPFLVEARDWARLPEKFHLEINRDHEVLIPGNNEMKRGWLFHPRFPSHWQSSSLYSMATWVNGIAFRNIQFSDSGWPVIKIAEIKSGISGQTKFTQQVFDESVLVQSGDLLFSWSGQPETSISAFWWRGRDGWLNQHVFKVNPIEDIDPRFFYYLLRYLQPNFVAIARNKQTTGLGHVTKSDLKNMEVACPDLAEQRAIARILYTLEDKIDLNRRMNQTLESMMRVIFKDWFVNFGPVRAKIEGRDTGLLVEIADLFPDRLVDSELGEAPEGWSTWSIQELADQHTCSTTPSSAPNTEFELFSIPAYDSGRMADCVRGATIRSNKVVVPPNSVLLSKLNPAISRVWLPAKSGGCQQICSTEFLVFTSRHPATRVLLYSVFTDLRFRDMLRSMVTGTSGSHQRVPVNELKLRKVFVGSRELMNLFGALIAPILARTIDSRVESHILGLLRDTLLPKLISGEIWVPDAKNLVGELA